jgi:hypothetical protein
MHATYVRQSSLTRNFEVKKIDVMSIIVTSYYVLQTNKKWDIERSENDRDAFAS